jgi:hypothetical protein
MNHMTVPADPAKDPVLLSKAAIADLDELPRSQARDVAEAIDRIRAGEPGLRLKFSPGINEASYYAMRTPNSDAPVVIYRALSETEGGGFLVTALVSDSDFKGYERADQKGILDKPMGRAVLGGAAALAVFAARGLSRR